VNLGSFKKYEIFSGDILECKLKGEHFFSKHQIVNMNDSLIMFENDQVIKLSQIKVIKLPRGSRLFVTFRKVFFRGGILYLSLNTINNLILNGAFRADPRALYISGSFLAASFILKQLSIKRIRVKSNVTLKVLDLNFQKLN